MPAAPRAGSTPAAGRAPHPLGAPAHVGADLLARLHARRLGARRRHLKQPSHGFQLRLALGQACRHARQLLAQGVNGHRQKAHPRAAADLADCGAVAAVLDAHDHPLCQARLVHGRGAAAGAHQLHACSGEEGRQRAGALRRAVARGEHRVPPPRKRRQPARAVPCLRSLAIRQPQCSPARLARRWARPGTPGSSRRSPPLLGALRQLRRALGPLHVIGRQPWQRVRAARLCAGSGEAQGSAGLRSGVSADCKQPTG